MHKIIIADDEVEIVDLLSLYLKRDQLDIYTANSGIEALRLFHEINPDLLLLDIMMPGLNGYELIKEIRQESKVPIMIISAKNQSMDKILALDLGADDYIEKPFDPLEVYARVQAILRRVHKFDRESPQTIIHCGKLTLDLAKCEIQKGEKVILLTPTELRILQLFMQEPGRVFTREQIYQVGWKNEFVDDNAIQVAISKIRSKIGEDCISTIRGLGYRFERK